MGGIPVFLLYGVVGALALAVSPIHTSIQDLTANHLDGNDTNAGSSPSTTPVGLYIFNGIDPEPRPTTHAPSQSTAANLSSSPSGYWKNTTASGPVVNGWPRANASYDDAFESIVGCNVALNDWSSSSLDFVLSAKTGIRYLYTVPLSTYLVRTSVSYDVTTLCDGKPRIVDPESDATSLFTWSTIQTTEVQTSISVFTPRYTVPPPTCSLDSKACRLLSSASSAQPLNTSLFPAGICQTTDASCGIGIGAATMLYWPVTTVGDAACGGNVSTITATPTGKGPNTAVVNGTIFTSPSVYIQLRNIMVRSRVSGALKVVSSADAVLAVPPTEVSSVCGYHGRDNTHSFNFADMNSPVPWSAYSCLPECWGEWSAACLPVGVLPYHPNIAFPTQLSNLNRIDPNWHGTCELGWGPYNSIWDPPIPLQQVGAIAGPTTPQAYSATSTTTLVTLPTPAVPSASLTPPAQETSAVTVSPTSLTASILDPGLPSSQAPLQPTGPSVSSPKVFSSPGSSSAGEQDATSETQDPSQYVNSESTPVQSTTSDPPEDPATITASALGVAPPQESIPDGKSITQTSTASAPANGNEDPSAGATTPQDPAGAVLSMLGASQTSTASAPDISQGNTPSAVASIDSAKNDPSETQSVGANTPQDPAGAVLSILGLSQIDTPSTVASTDPANDGNDGPSQTQSAATNTPQYAAGAVLSILHLSQIGTPSAVASTESGSDQPSMTQSAATSTAQDIAGAMLSMIGLLSHATYPQDPVSDGMTNSYASLSTTSTTDANTVGPVSSTTVGGALMETRSGSFRISTSSFASSGYTGIETSYSQSNNLPAITSAGYGTTQQTQVTVYPDPGASSQSSAESGYPSGGLGSAGISGSVTNVALTATSQQTANVETTSTPSSGSAGIVEGRSMVLLLLGAMWPLIAVF